MKLRASIAAAALLVTLVPAKFALADPSPPAPLAPAPAVTDPVQAKAQLQAVLREPEYQETTAPDTNAQVRDWLSRWFTKMGEDFNRFEYNEHMPRLTSLLTTVFVALAIAGLVYIFARLRRRGRGHEPLSGEAVAGRILQPPEFYEEELRQAVAEKNWHAAWLASWRQFLSRLEQGRMVDADRSRTNREYLSQLRGQSLPAGATTLLPALVDAYDTFIYGRKAIGEPDWSTFQQQVNEAALMLHLEERARDEAPASQP